MAFAPQVTRVRCDTQNHAVLLVVGAALGEAELTEHATLRIDAGLAGYFCDPRSPWQRGTNENTNRLLRQYFPKGVSMGALTQHDLEQVAAKLNARPRKRLGFDSPANRFEALLR